MRARESLITLFCSTLISGVLLFNSCAHQTRVADEGTESQPEELAGLNNAVQPPPTEKETTLAEQVDPNKAQADAKNAVANPESQPVPELPPSDQAKLDELSGIAPTDANKDQKAELPPELQTPPTFDKQPASSSGSVGPSHLPVIPTQAFTRKGANLNRFYFTRKGDNPDSVSNLIYSNGDKSKSLIRWNKGASHWTPGKVIYYNSPSQPDDKEMHSFYQERGLTPEEYTISRGDWLSKVAQTKLGHRNSWKEIAVVNGIENPDTIKPGQKIAIYPAELSGAPAAPQNVAQNESAPAAQEPKNTQPAPQTPPAPVQPAPEAAPQTPPMTENVVPPAQEPAHPATPDFSANKNKFDVMNIDFAKLIEQNLFAVAMGGMILLLLIALRTLNRKKKSKRDDFGGEDFSAPRMKRK